MSRPARPYRIIRGEAAEFRVHNFLTKEARDAAAERFANQDGQEVLLEVWDADHPQDELNLGWGCVGVKYPEGQEPIPDPRPTITVTSLTPGTQCEVWAFPSTDFTTGKSGFVAGTVTDVERVVGYLSIRVTFDDGRIVWAVPTAVVRLNQEA